MPSCLLFVQSGGIRLVSGNPWSGSLEPFGGIQLKLARGAPGVVYVGIARQNPPDTSYWSGFLSGLVTITSGGSLSSGGLGDGMELSPGDSYYVPRTAVSGRIEAIRVAAAAASSGGRLFWEWL